MRRLAFSLVLLLAFTAPTSAAESHQALTIDFLLTLSSHEQLHELANAKYSQLNHLLQSVTDGRSARQCRPDVERLYMEIQLLHARGAMLPTPTADEKLALAPLIDKIERSRQNVYRECDRISKSSTLTHELLSVIQPIYLGAKQNRAAQAASVASQLQTLRSQIELYKLQHRDELPDFKSNGWKPLTQRTTDNGQFTKDADYGPYLRNDPRNPLNGNSRILVLRGQPKPDFENPTRDCGFIFDQSTGQIWALDADGKLFDESSATADTR